MKAFLIGWCCSLSWLVIPFSVWLVRSAFSASLDLGD